MRQRIEHFLSRGRGQDGFTLIEILVVCVLLAVVLSAVTAPIVVSQRNQTRNANYSYAQEQGRAGLDSMVSQIRQATAILSATSNSLELNVSLGGTALQVYYECDVPQPGTQYHECLRVQSAQGGILPPLSTGKVVLTNLINGTIADPVFTLYPNSVAPYYMTATIKVPASGGASGGLTSSVVFSDGALMRNLNVGN
ncbi:MAG TPA: prepilin-type N-terminal cleavage/methylation domain-containing protein [Solirubrobacteraceae bacterium]|jgi:prepilin-type N-terminal cleavage/methylation domain-containing protein|nr:prepilin-type N-terminal cleavage/methylation domain-containing protein [Solirubrobacteraceae bacterium]